VLSNDFQSTVPGQ